MSNVSKILIGIAVFVYIVATQNIINGYNEINTRLQQANDQLRDICMSSSQNDTDLKEKYFKDEE